MPTPAQIDEQVQLERDQIAQGLKRLRKNTSKLEDKIRQYPDHYFWFHRKWSGIIENEKKNYK